MPYDGKDDPGLPDRVKAWSEDRRITWVRAWNRSFSACRRDGGDNSECEGEAFRIAYTAANAQTREAVVELEWIDALTEGGPGSGNWGHKGIKGRRGGSAPRGGGGVAGQYLRANYIGAEPPLSMCGLDKFAGEVDPFNPTHSEDLVLKEILHAQGFDGLPQVVDELAVPEGGVELWRGVATGEQAEQFRSGDLYSGRGGGGSGTYTTTDQGYAQNYSGGTPDAVVHMALRPGAKTITNDELREIRAQYKERLAGRPSPEEQKQLFTQYRRAQREGRQADADEYMKRLDGSPHPQREQLERAYADPGRLAAAMGYDAIDQGFDVYLILNRTALIVEAGQ